MGMTKVSCGKEPSITGEHLQSMPRAVTSELNMTALRLFLNLSDALIRARAIGMMQNQFAQRKST